MSQIEFFHYEAFTDTPGMGNPAGIVFDTKGMLTEEEMQRIAASAYAVNESGVPTTAKPRRSAPPIARPARVEEV